MGLEKASYYVEGLRNGDRRILAKTITLIESALPDHQKLARKVIEEILPYTGKAIRLGITGVPGVGKSTFIECFGQYLVKEKSTRIAVLAVDPSSTRSGGSIMADKTRMELLSKEASAFIRPTPSGGTLGGVARKTRETILVCEAAGFDLILVETVGVGQSETAVASMVDFFLVLMLAGAGDELQGIKKGVLELADAIAITKADGDNVDKAERARRQYENALHLLRPISEHWSPPVVTCSSLDNLGMDTIWDVIGHHRQQLSAVGELTQKRKTQAVNWMWALIENGLKDMFQNHPDVQQALPPMIASVEQGRLTPTAAANTLLSHVVPAKGDGQALLRKR